MSHDLFRSARIFSHWRVRPSFGESATTYFASLVAETEDCTPRSYAERFGLLSGPNPSERILSELLRLPIAPDQKATLVRWTPMHSQEEQAWTLCGHRIAGKRFAELDRRCQACIRDAAYHRVWWDLQDFETCPIHDIPLDRLQKNRNSDYMRWTFHGLCRKPLTDPPRLSRRGRESFEGYLLHRLGAAEGVDACPLLDDQPLDGVMKAVRDVGRFLSSPRSETRQPSTRPDAAEKGFAALCGDARRLEDAFSVWLVANVPPQELGHVTFDHFGYFRQWLMPEGELKDTVRAAMLQAAARHGVLTNVLRTKPGVEVPLHLAAMAGETSLTRHGVTTLLRKLWPEMTTERLRAGIPFAIAEQVRSVAAEAVPLASAAKLLGCTKEQATVMSRCLSLDGRRVAISKTGTRSARLFFIRSELDQMLETLSSLPLEPRTVRTVGMRTFARHHARGMGRIMADVVTGKLPAYRGASDGLQSVLFKRPEKLGRGGKAAKVGRTQVPQGAMLSCEFTAITGASPASIPELVRQGFVSPYGATRGLLDRASALAFHRRYVNPVRYMMGRGMIAIDAIWALKRMKLPLAFAHETIRPYFAERSEFEARIGPLYHPTDKEMAQWRLLIRLAGENCPSFIVPELPGDGPVYVYMSSRKFSFRVSFQEGGLFLTAEFKPESRRIWQIYSDNRDVMHELLSSFSWQVNGEEATASVLAGDEERLATLTKQLGELATYFRYKMPSQR